MKPRFPYNLTNVRVCGFVDVSDDLRFERAELVLEIGLPVSGLGWNPDELLMSP